MESHPTQKGLSIVMKMSILAASITAIASFIVGSLVVNGSADIVYQDALNRLKYETNIKSLRLVSDIENLSGDTQYLVGTPPITGIPRAINNGGIDPTDNSRLSIWQSRLATIFSELIRAKSSYLQIRYIGLSEKGKELIRVERSGNKIRNTPESNLQSKGETTYFKNAIKLKPGEVYLSKISLNKEFGEISKPHTPVIRAATPVYFNDKLFGILVINMELGKTFNDLVRNTPRELTPYVTNEDGYFLAHPNRKMVFGFDLDNENTIHSIYPSFNLQQNNDLRDTEFTVETDGDVVHVVKAFFDVNQKERFLSVMLATSHENLQSKSVQLRRKSFTVIGILVIISLIIAAALARRLMQPLHLITTASEDFANGHDVINLPVNAKDEIGELARAFNHMRWQIKNKEQELLISQGHVHHANKMASLGEMAASMAHEINSPIQTISLIAQRVQRQLKKNMSAEDIDASMEKISANVNKISEIIDSLRKLSRNSTDDDFSNVKIGELLEDVINMTAERFKVNNVHFEINYHGLTENTLIQCQRLQISQVLINLVNNAYDAIQIQNEKWIRIDIRHLQHSAQISVTDSGTGIHHDNVEKIFEPMFTTKDIGKGTGLGLSISHDIVTNHNGLFYVDKESENTRLVLELPFVYSKQS